MAEQSIRLTLSIKTMGVNRSVMKTIKFLAYKLGHDRFKTAYNAFDGDKATPELRKFFNLLIDGAKPLEGYSENRVETGAGYVKFDLTFSTPITFAGAQYLLNVMRPFLRNGERNPLAIAVVEGYKVFFVHYLKDNALDYRLVPFTSEVTTATDADTIYRYLTARIKDNPSAIEAKLRTLYDNQ